MDGVSQSPDSFQAHVERVAQALEARSVGSPEVAPVSRDAVREVIKSFAEQAPEYVPQPSPVQAVPPVQQPAVGQPSVPVTTPGTTLDVLPDYLRVEGADPAVIARVESLVTEAFREGLMHALRSARGAPPIVEDAFHDALVDIVVPILKERHRL